MTQRRIAADINEHSPGSRNQYLSNDGCVFSGCPLERVAGFSLADAAEGKARFILGSGTIRGHGRWNSVVFRRWSNPRSDTFAGMRDPALHRHGGLLERHPILYRRIAPISYALDNAGPHINERRFFFIMVLESGLAGARQRHCAGRRHGLGRKAFIRRAKTLSLAGRDFNVAGRI
ncbi:hypothetical protein [Duganella aceris]|uniref:hypothetical protein n=1 Tax=Duganella aceris TaxID=2703883 RepID=UPI001E2F82E9|nr:hypothetical protein [Duganella aceris]